MPEVMQAERGNLTKNSSNSQSNGSEVSISVRDARRRFEELSSTSPRGAGDPPSLPRGSPVTRTRPLPMKKPLKKTETEPDFSTRKYGNTSNASNARVQSSVTQTVNNNSASVSGGSDTQDVGKSKSKSKIFMRPSLKKAHSISTHDNLAVKPRSSINSSENKVVSPSKKLFRRRSMDKGKIDDTSSNSTTTTNERTGYRSTNHSPTSNSPSHKKFSPLPLKKKTVDSKTRETDMNSNSQTTSPTQQKSSPLSSKKQKSIDSSNATSPLAAEKKIAFHRSFSDVVLASSNHRPVQTSLTKKDKSSITPKFIEDGELKLFVKEGLQLSGAELKSILSKQFAYISGGLEGGRRLILTFPDRGLKQLETPESFDELITTITYFKSLISIKQISAGFTLLLDAHSSKTHTPARQLLERIVKDFPVSVHMIFIFMKPGIFGRNKSLASTDVCSKLHLANYTDPKSLVEQLGAENLTSEFGGTLIYDHSRWVFNRLEFEKMQALHCRAMTRMPEVTKALSVCQTPSSVKEAEHLMQEDLKLKEKLINYIAEAELNIDRFLAHLQNQEGGESVDEALNSDVNDYVTMKKALKGMLEDLRTSQGQFDSFWTIHKARVDHMMRMCHFKRTAEKLEVMIRQYIDDLTAGGVYLGDTLEVSLELGEKHEAFVTKYKSSVEEQIGKLREDADVLINPRFLPDETEAEENMHEATKGAVERVKTTIKELNDIYQQLITMCQQKRDLFIVCVKFHMTTRQCSQWNQDVLEFLASQPMESPTFKQANSLISKIDEFLHRVQPIQIQSLQELVKALPEEKQFQRSVQKTVQKYEHCCDLLNNRKAALLRILSSSPHSKSKKKHKHDKEKDKPDIELVNSIEPADEPVHKVTQSLSLSVSNPEASLYLSKTLANEHGDYSDGENNAATLKKREFVYKELIATEQDYIRDLKIVIDSYYDAMADEEVMSMPLRLRGKRDVVFGNLPEIYKFHDLVFSKALEQFSEHPERIGECFVQFNEEFQMYSLYCKNRSNSETLLNESTESEAFFKGIQRNLAHQLPLNSYLLKPVQRITKYQLLLKDMMKHSVNAKKAHTDLQQALDRMLKVLKNLNDSLHVVGLKGFPGALAEQGRLLVHDAFHVWEGSASRSLFSRAKERHVFLYEKVIIFSKKIEAPVQKKAKKSDNYLYKDHLELAELALRETLDGQPLQFSLTVHGQQNKDFRFQAQDKEIHAMWTKEIRRLLQVQFMLMKDMVIKSGTLDRRTYKGKAAKRTDSRLFGDSFKERPTENASKKSISDRFKLLKRKKPEADPTTNKVKKSMNSSESSLLASSSYPASIRFALKGSTSPSNSTQSNMESTEAEKKFADIMSSDEDLAFSEDDDDDDDSFGTVAVDHYESLAPGAPRYYIAISTYSPGDSDENGIGLCLDQEVEVIGINKYGWWWIRATNPSNGEVEEGWVPASYLKVSGSLDHK